MVVLLNLICTCELIEYVPVLVMYNRTIQSSLLGNVVVVVVVVVVVLFLSVG